MKSSRLAARRRGVTARLALGLALAASSASADEVDDVKDRCATTAERGQNQKNSGLLIAARQALVACSMAECPAAVRNMCLAWLPEVEADLPSIVVAARDPSGRDLSEIRVLVDGVERAPRLDGLPIVIDPGQHVVRFEAPGAKPVTRELFVRVGEKGRRIEIVLGVPVAVTPPASRRPVPLLTYVLGGVGLAAWGVAGYAYLDAMSYRDDLKTSCAPHCADDARSTLNRHLLVADIGLAVGVAAFAGAAIALLLRPSMRTTER